MLKQRGVGLGAVLVLLAMMSGGLFWYLIKAPLYSLWQAQRAFQQHDLIAFGKYVDVETMIGRMIDQITAANVKAAQKSGHLWEQLVQKIARGLVPMVKPQLEKRLQEQLEACVEKGKFADNQNDSNAGLFSIQYLYQKAGGDNLEFKGAAYVKKAGKIAVVGLKLYHKTYAATMILELKMHNRGGYWQVAEFNNLPDYLKNLDVLEARHKRSAGD